MERFKLRLELSQDRYLKLLLPSCHQMSRIALADGACLSFHHHMRQDEVLLYYG